MKLKDSLKNKLTKKELELVPSSFDVVGDIAIFSKFPEELKKKEKKIGEELIRLNKHIKVVAKKVKGYSGKYRLPKLKIIAGEKRKTTLHKENNCLIRINPESCYFSTRMGNERLRIAKLVKKDENVLVMFSGVGVFPVVISKNSKAKEIFGVEINPSCCKLAEENLELNSINNIKLYKGDVKRVLLKINKKFDRIVMPLPKDSESYLKLALKKLKNKGVIHLYLFSQEKDFNKLKREYKKNFKKVKLVKCGVYSPYVYRVCLDLKT